jgi:hypothetical protein
MTLQTQTTESVSARQTLADWLGIQSDLLAIVSGGALRELDNLKLVGFVQKLEGSRDTISRIERVPEDRLSRHLRAAIVQAHDEFLDQMLRLCAEELNRRLRTATRAGRRRSSDRRADRTGQGFSPPASAQPRTAAAKASALSVRSQVKSGSSRPK